MDLFSAFVSRWNATGSAPPASSLQVAEFEHALSLLLPRAYVRFVTTHGFPYTPGILRAVVDGSLDLHAIQQFEPLSRLRELTHSYEQGGMPPGFVAFAVDCAGNLFLFARGDCVGSEDAPVWLFDHDFDTVDSVAPSFLSFIARYSTLGSPA